MKIKYEIYIFSNYKKNNSNCILNKCNTKSHTYDKLDIVRFFLATDKLSDHEINTKRTATSTIMMKKKFNTMAEKFKIKCHKITRTSI